MLENEIQVILVDEDDQEKGVMEKLEAHQKGVLHRAISVFILNSEGQWLLQQRAFDKYHSKGLWTNTCCSHPYPGESSLESANRRLREEMGMSSDLQELFSFTYQEALENELIEHELDHVFVGFSDSEPQINSEEVHDFKYLSYEELHQDVRAYPDNYTVWFKMIYQKVHQHLSNKT